MSISLIKQGDTVQTYIMKYVADTRADLETLPKKYAPGSTCFVIEDSSSWCLNSKGQWVEIDTGAGGGSGSESIDIESIPDIKINGLFDTE